MITGVRMCPLIMCNLFVGISTLAVLAAASPLYIQIPKFLGASGDAQPD
jgi:hypothetical protein